MFRKDKAGQGLITNNHNGRIVHVESMSLKTCLEQISDNSFEKQRQTIRVVSEGLDRKVYLEPEGIQLTCVESVDVHIDSTRQRLVMTIPDRHFEVDVSQKA